MFILKIFLFCYFLSSYLFSQETNLDGVDSQVPAPNAQKTNLEKSLESGKKLYLEDNYDQAIVLLSEVLQKDPENPEIYLYLALSYEKTNRDLIAQSLLTSALELRAASSSSIEYALYFNLANVLFKQKKYDDALKNYSRAIRLRPAFVQAFLNRANTYIELKDGDNAILDYNRYLIFNPNAPQRPQIERIIDYLSQNKLVKEPEKIVIHAESIQSQTMATGVLGAGELILRDSTFLNSLKEVLEQKIEQLVTRVNEANEVIRADINDTNVKLDESIASIDSKLNQTNENIANLGTQITQTNENITNLDTKITDNNSKIDENLANLDNKLTETNVKIDENQQETQTQLQEQAQSLANKDAELSTKIDELSQAKGQSNLDNANPEELKAYIKTLEDQISAIREAQTIVEQKLTEAQDISKELVEEQDAKSVEEKNRTNKILEDILNSLDLSYKKITE